MYILKLASRNPPNADLKSLLVQFEGNIYNSERLSVNNKLIRTLVSLIDECVL